MQSLSGEEICVPSGRIRIPPPQRFGFDGVGAMCIITSLLLPLWMVPVHSLHFLLIFFPWLFPQGNKMEFCVWFWWGGKKKGKMIHSQADISLLLFKLLNRKLMYLHNSLATTVTEAQEDGKSPMLARRGLRSDFCRHSKEISVSQHLLENLCGILLGWKDVCEHLCGGDNLITYRVESVYKWHGGEFEIVCVSRWLNRTPNVTLFCCLLQKTEWFTSHVFVKQWKNTLIPDEKLSY